MIKLPKNFTRAQNSLFVYGDTYQMIWSFINSISIILSLLHYCYYCDSIIIMVMIFKVKLLTPTRLLVVVVVRELVVFDAKTL
jgi:hypothetical protein